MRPELTRRDRGISLIEVVVAVLVLSIGVIAGFRAVGQAQRGIGQELPRLLAHQVAVNRAEEMQIVGAGGGLPAQVVMGGIAWNVSVERAGTLAGFVQATIRVTSSGQPGAVLVGFAPEGPPQ